MTSPVWTTPVGLIADIIENTGFTYNLAYSGVPTPSVTLIAGSLPLGLSMNSSGVISGVATIETVDKQYDFAVRIENVDGFADRSFYITVSDILPIWSSPANLGSYLPNVPFELDLSVSDPGGITKIFEKIAGSLPSGLTMNSFGKIYGTTGDVTVATLYTFSIRCILDGIKFIDKTFTITIDPLAVPQPLWLTPSGLIANILTGEAFSTSVLAIDPLGGSVTYSILPAYLPPNITLNSITGEISGTLISPQSQIYAIPVTATLGAVSISRTFLLNANNLVTYPVSWITPSGNLGTILEGEKSIFGVRAESDSIWVRYELISGSLPAGLSVDINTGDIWGIAENQVTADTEFTFTIRAYNEYMSADQTFSLTLINNYDFGATRTFVTLYGVDKLIWVDLFTTPEILHGNIFREGDAQYGLIEQPKIMLTENLDNPTADAIKNILTGVRRTYLNLGHVEVAQAKKDGNVIYEVLYRRIFDDSAGSLLEYIDPVTLVNAVRPGSLTNIRTKLSNLAFSGGNDMLPLWMQETGWFPCIAFAHVKPLTGQTIADRINANDQQLRKLYQNRVRVDRFIVEPSASTDFAPYPILFDGNY